MSTATKITENTGMETKRISSAIFFIPIISCYLISKCICILL